MLPDPIYETATVGDGVQLAYIDSWAARAKAELPPTYTTILALHGFGFNSAVWTPILAHLPPDVRFLSYNQRDYAGSSPALPLLKPEGTDATAAYLGDLLDFVDFADAELGVPAVGANRKGGIVLLAWSKAVTLPVALLAATQNHPASDTAFTSSLPDHLITSHPTLHSHLRSIILYEPATPTLGLPNPASFLAALGPAMAAPPSPATPYPLATALGQYVAGYRAGADVAALPPSSVEAVQAAAGAGVWQPECFGRARWALAASAEEMGALARRALAESAWPVGLVWGTATVEFCSEAVAEVERVWAEAGKERKGGKRATRAVEGMNHVGQALMPKEFATAVLELIEELGA